MAANKNLTIKILADSAVAERAFNRTTKASDKFGRSVRQSGSGRKAFGGVAKSVAGVAGAYLGAAGLLTVMQGAVKGASDVSESLSKNRVLFQKNAKSVENFSDRSAKAFGISKQAALEYTGVFGNLFTAVGVSRKDAAKSSVALTQLGADLASFNNTSIDQALEALRSGLVGETEPLRKFGVNINDAQLRTEALRQGLIKNTKEALDPQTKALAAQGLIFKQTQAAQGDFARTSGGLANQQRILSAQFSDAQAKLGQALIPSLTKGANAASKLITELASPHPKGFAKTLKDIYTAAVPVFKKFIEVGKAVFKFAAEHPNVVKLAASLAAVGLAIKAIRFTSKLTGISEFLGAGRAAMKTFKSIFARAGAQAGASAMSSAAASAADQAAGGVMTAGGRANKFKTSGKGVGKWIGRGLAAGIVAGIVIFGPELAKSVNRWFEANLPSWVKKLLNFGLSGGSPFGDPGPIPGVGANGASAKGATAKGASNVRSAAGNQYAGYLPDPLTGGPGLEPQLVDAEKRAAKLQGQLDSAITKAGSKISAGEKKRITELKNLVRGANTAVTGLQTKMGRRDALLEVRDQMRTFVDDAVTAYGAGLEKIAQTSFDNANKAAQGELNSALKSFDEQYGNSPQAVRLRELRAKQETDARAGQDKVYSDERADLEAQLSRAIRNGRTTTQRELNAQILALDTARADTLREREIAELSSSLQLERDNATSVFEAKTTAIQDTYDAAVASNDALVTAYKTSLDSQTADLLKSLEDRKISYKAYIDALNAMGAGLIPPVVGSPSVEAPIGQPTPTPSTPSTGTKPFGTQVVDWVKAHVKAGTKSKPTHTTATRVAAGLGGGVTKGQVIAAGLESTDFVGRSLLAGGRVVDKKVSGGLLRPGALTLVGETGPELVMGGRVNSATRTANMGGGAGMNITINASGAAANDPQLLARELGWQLSTR
ncbi:MAG: hypothetical protein ACOYOI_04875 [Chthoniobacterales bacterium]